MIKAEIEDTLRGMLERRKAQATAEAELILSLAERVDAALARAEKAEGDVEALKAGYPDDVTDLVTQVRMLEDRAERAIDAIKTAERVAWQMGQTDGLKGKHKTALSKARDAHQRAVSVLRGTMTFWNPGEESEAKE